MAVPQNKPPFSIPPNLFPQVGPTTAPSGSELFRFARLDPLANSVDSSMPVVLD